ncbi:MAG: hypothetical protein LAN71_15315 [Acidobacteriia bacterium]|nr:hypothetical protein [Terriglobia bacterium]
METSPAHRTREFPPQLDPAELDLRGAPESFTWGPPAAWLLCVLLWLFFHYLRDAPEVAQYMPLLLLGLLLLAALAAAYDLRRRKRRIVLFPLDGRIGCYREGVLQYSFAPEEMVRVRLYPFDWIMVSLKLLLPLLLLMAGTGVFLYDSLVTSPVPNPRETVLSLGFLIFFSAFGLVASVRSRAILCFFWIPSGNGKTDTPLHLHRRILSKLHDGPS